MNSGSMPCAPRYLELTASTCEPPCASPRLPKSPLGEPEMRECAGVGAGQLGDHLLDRAAGGELHHDESHQHDAEHGGDHEQQAADDVGAHGSSQYVIPAGARKHVTRAVQLRPQGRPSPFSQLIPPWRVRTTRCPEYRENSAVARRETRTRPNRRSSATLCTSAESNSGRRGRRGRARGRRWSVRSRVLAAMMASISASIAGSAMPARFCVPLMRGRLRREIGAQRIARRRGKAQALDGDVEIETVDARAVLHRIDDAQRRLDAERA